MLFTKVKVQIKGSPKLSETTAKLYLNNQTFEFDLWGEILQFYDAIHTPVISHYCKLNVYLCFGPVLLLYSLQIHSNIPKNA